MSIFTKWRALQTCAADRPGRPPDTATSVNQESSVSFNLPRTCPNLCSENVLLQNSQNISSHGAVTLHYTTALIRREEKTFERLKKTCRQNGDCLGCYYGNCQSNCKVPDVPMTTEDDVNLCHNNLSIKPTEHKANIPVSFCFCWGSINLFSF